MLKYLLIITFAFAFVASSWATLLYDSDLGTVYDDVADITWMVDANYIETSDADVDGNDDGYVTWQEATTWVEALEYAGGSDWRLPSGSGAEEGFGAYGELGDLYYNGLSNTARSSNPNTGFFTNVQRYGYWTSESNGIQRWTFSWSNGASTLVDRDTTRAVWPVHDGDLRVSVGDTWQGSTITWQGETAQW